MPEHRLRKTTARSAETVKPDSSREIGDEISEPLNLNRFTELTKRLLLVSRDDLRDKEVDFAIMTMISL
jgi:hypothetical protein